MPNPKKSVLLLLALVIACQGGEPETKSPSVEVDESGGYDRIALFLGINAYTHSTVKPLQGCVNDIRNLRRVLKRQYGYARTMLRKDDACTRDGIKEGLVWLMRQADAAKAKGIRPTVVLAYSGHGNWRPVDRNDAGIERDRKDETWIASESNAMGGRDVLDDDVGKVLRYLDESGATAIYVSDSCHSGTSHRGTEEALTRSARSDDDTRDMDPLPKSLFPDLGPATDMEKLRVVHLAACLDHQKAREGLDDDGKPCGRFSYALAKALEQNRGSTTWANLLRRTTDIMAARWDGTDQAPIVHVFGGLDRVPCFGGDPLPPYIMVKPDSQDGNRITIDAGAAHGVAPGMRIEFFASTDDMRDGKRMQASGKPVAGTVVGVAAGESTVQLEHDAKLPNAAVAEMVDASVPDFKLHAHGEMPPAVKAMLDKVFTDKMLAEGTKDSFSVQLRWDKESDVLRLYLPGSLPSEGRPDPSFLRLRYDRIEALKKDLVTIALRRRMLGLERNERYLRVSVALRKPRKEDGETDADMGRLLDAAPEKGRPFPTFVTAPGSGEAKIVITLESTHTRPLQVFLFAFEECRPGSFAADDRFDQCVPKDPADRPPFQDVFLLYPQGRDPIAFVPGRTQTNGELSLANLVVWVGDKIAGKSRMRIKVLAIERPEDAPYPRDQFSKIYEPLANQARSADDGLGMMMSDLAKGGARGGGSDAVKDFWATGVVVFDIATPK